MAGSQIYRYLGGVLVLAVLASASKNRYTASLQNYKEAALSAACGAVENHTVYDGHDVGGDPSNGTKVGSLQECCDLCNSNAECRFLTYNVPTCYMKTSDARHAPQL
jgi:hypothetical protein